MDFTRENLATNKHELTFDYNSTNSMPFLKDKNLGPTTWVTKLMTKHLQEEKGKKCGGGLS